MVTTAPAPSPPSLLVRAMCEFVLTTVVLFVAVTVVRWLRDPGSALCIADVNRALGVIGILSGAVLTALILSPAGRLSGGHTNPAVTLALWLLGAFEGRGVLPYLLAQASGSVAGTGLAGVVWGPAVSLPTVADAVIKPASTWPPVSVFLAEAGSMAALVMVVGLFLAHPARMRLLPPVIGLSVALVITLLGPLSGGSINPARQFGPAAFSGRTTDLWIYLIAPILGAALGAALHRVVASRSSSHRPASRDAGETTTVPVPGDAGETTAGSRPADDSLMARTHADERPGATPLCAARAGARARQSGTAPPPYSPWSPGRPGSERATPRGPR